MKSAKWTIMVMALSTALAGCTKAAESKDRAPGDQPRPSAAADTTGAEADPELERGAPEAAEPEAAEPTVVVEGAGDVPVVGAARGAAKQLAPPSAAIRAPTAMSDVKIEKQYYTLEIKVPPAAAPGKASELVFTLVPKNGRHLNHEFPTKLTIAPPAGVTVAKPTLKKSDATTFTDDLGVFKVGFTATDAGEKTFSGKFKFATCTDTTCDPQTETLAFKVTVK